MHRISAGWMLLGIVAGAALALMVGWPRDELLHLVSLLQSPM